VCADHGESNIVAMIEFSSGAIVTYIALSSSFGDWEIRLHGESVEARLSPLERGTIRLGQHKPRALPESCSPKRGSRADLLAQATAFVEAVRNPSMRGYPMSDFSDHAKSIALAEQIERMATDD
jgi:hypothetical protein